MDISPRLLKFCAPLISHYLTTLFNRSLSSGFLPRDRLDATITPIYKRKGPRNEATNPYRPISLLSCTAKVLERLVSSALYAHTENIIPEVQSGYRRKDNTVFQLTRIVHQVSATLDKGQQALACFFDLSKAFHRVSHSQLLQKLERYNITGSAVLKWFEGYLTHRRQRVRVNQSVSSWQNIPDGVPQGSCSWPSPFCHIDIRPSSLRLVNLQKTMSLATCLPMTLLSSARTTRPQKLAMVFNL